MGPEYHSLGNKGMMGLLLLQMENTLQFSQDGRGYQRFMRLVLFSFLKFILYSTPCGISVLPVLWILSTIYNLSKY